MKQAIKISFLVLLAYLSIHLTQAQKRKSPISIRIKDSLAILYNNTKALYQARERGTFSNEELLTEIQKLQKLLKKFDKDYGRTYAWRRLFVADSSLLMFQVARLYIQATYLMIDPNPWTFIKKANVAIKYLDSAKNIKTVSTSEKYDKHNLDIEGNRKYRPLLAISTHLLNDLLKEVKDRQIFIIKHRRTLLRPVKKKAKEFWKGNPKESKWYSAKGRIKIIFFDNVFKRILDAKAAGILDNKELRERAERCQKEIKFFEYRFNGTTQYQTLAERGAAFFISKAVLLLVSPARADFIHNYKQAHAYVDQAERNYQLAPIASGNQHHIYKAYKEELRLNKGTFDFIRGKLRARKKAIDIGGHWSAGVGKVLTQKQIDVIDDAKGKLVRAYKTYIKFASYRDNLSKQNPVDYSTVDRHRKNAEKLIKQVEGKKFRQLMSTILSRYGAAYFLTKAEIIF